MHPLLKNAHAVKRLPSGALVSRFVVGGGEPWLVFQTLEPATWGSHGSLEHFADEKGKDKLFGKVTTRRAAPKEIEALPAGSDERVKAFRAWFASLYDESYHAILEAFPELESVTSASRSMGEITVSGDPALALLASAVPA